MKCPLFYTGWLEHESEDSKQHTDCLQEECAWWDKDNGQCGVATLANGMWILDQLVTGIVNKMPHEAQFRK